MIFISRLVLFLQIPLSKDRLIHILMRVDNLITLPLVSRVETRRKVKSSVYFIKLLEREIDLQRETQKIYLKIFAKLF